MKDEILKNLNEEQKKAVTHENGPLLILAGAGSGKTRVLTRRIAYLIEECGINPWSILALTFTNKAAKEMRERVDALLGGDSESIWVSTFHSVCVRILRRFIEAIGYDRKFTIYDTDDTKAVMKNVLKELNIDNKKFPERSFLAAISKAKNNLISAERFSAVSGYGMEKDLYKKVYAEYEKRMKSNNALDFDDLLVKTVELFEKNEDVLDYYRRRFRYILVDEYQDTNYVQFRLLKLLANHINEDGELERNLCVVGDDDQSIYKFRGADIYNILNFENEYPGAKVIKLEENYRSTGNILEAANGVIRNNSERKDKRLWTEKGSGASITSTRYTDGYREAEGIASIINKTVEAGKAGYSDIAVLYRTNAQSRTVEEKLIFNSIPYKLIGGVNFYGRREIKDILAYFRAINNIDDDVQVRRILNVPRRGIGAATEEKIAEYAAENGMSFFEAARRVEYIPGLARSKAKVESFVSFIEAKRRAFSEEGISISKEAEELISEIGYIDELAAENTDEAQARIENIEELISKIVSFEKENEELLEDETVLEKFLSDVSLVADIDMVEDGAETVTLMTLHAAKGLEFPIVFICGMEEGLFPSYMSLSSGDDGELEEERRLCYVGITRAKEKLYLSYAGKRILRGTEQYNRPSRFLDEIPPHLVSENGERGSEIRNETVGRNGDFSSERRFSGGMGLKKESFGGGKNLFYNNPYIQKGFGGENVKNNEELMTGDRVTHIKFGSGAVTGISADGEQITVKFDNEKFGVRKMKTAFSGLKKA